MFSNLIIYLDNETSLLTLFYLKTGPKWVKAGVKWVKEWYVCIKNKTYISKKW